MVKRFKSNIAILLFLFRNVNGKREVLLQKRIGDYSNNMWDASCSGHVEANESFSTATIREAKEELGIDIYKDNLKFMRLYQDYIKQYVNVVFCTEIYNGNPIIKENDKCKELEWFCIDKLPEGIIGYVKESILEENMIYNDCDIKIKNANYSGDNY